MFSWSEKLFWQFWNLSNNQRCLGFAVYLLFSLFKKIDIRTLQGVFVRFFGVCVLVLIGPICWKQQNIYYMHEISQKNIFQKSPLFKRCTSIGGKNASQLYDGGYSSVSWKQKKIPYNKSSCSGSKKTSLKYSDDLKVTRHFWKLSGNIVDVFKIFDKKFLLSN